VDTTWVSRSRSGLSAPSSRKMRFAAARNQRIDHEPELIDQPVLDQRPHELRAAHHQQVAPVFLLQGGYGLGDVAHAGDDVGPARRKVWMPRMIGPVSIPQSGIFALGTASHAYLEFELRRGREGRDLVKAIAGLREPRTTMGGVNLVTGFRPELWGQVAPDDAPRDVSGFNEDLIGSDGFVMPATQHDAVLWLSGSAYDVIFDTAREAIAALDALVSVAEETSSWPYRHDRDLTGFIDGTENPSLVDAPEVALVPRGSPGAGGTVLLLQKWAHDGAAWESLPVSRQERAIGRTKLDSVELEDKAPESHVGRTDQEQFGKIFRRNMPYGTVMDHGTMFVGFSAEQHRLSAMLESMAGVAGGIRDELTRYARPLTGAYYFVPSTQSLQRRTAVESE